MVVLLTFELLLNISLSLSYFNTANFYDNAQHSQLCMITDHYALTTYEAFHFLNISKHLFYIFLKMLKKYFLRTACILMSVATSNIHLISCIEIEITIFIITESISDDYGKQQFATQ